MGKPTPAFGHPSRLEMGRCICHSDHELVEGEESHLWLLKGCQRPKPTPAYGHPSHLGKGENHVNSVMFRVTFALPGWRKEPAMSEAEWVDREARRDGFWGRSLAYPRVIVELRMRFWILRFTQNDNLAAQSMRQMGLISA
jgi:hypothetical protein